MTKPPRQELVSESLIAIRQGGRLMAVTLTEEVRLYLRTLTGAQQELAAAFEQKFEALQNGQPEEIHQITQREAVLTKRLSQMTGERQRLLDKFKASGRAVDSVQAVVSLPEHSQDQELQELIQLATLYARSLRQESWKQWIMIQRSHQYYNEVLELIANRGESAPTYQAKRSTDTAGGAILDASA